MKVEKISNRQLLFILFMIQNTIILSTLPVFTTGNADQNAWIAAIMSTFGMVAIAAYIGGLSLKFPGLTVIEYSSLLLGKYAGAFFSFSFLWVFLHIAATDTRIYADLIGGQFLRETSFTFIITVMVVLSALAVYMGIETIGRAADALFPWFLLFVLLSLGVSLTGFDIQNLQPVLAQGWGPVLSSTASPIGFAAHVIALTMLIPALNKPEKGVTVGMQAMLAAGIILTMAAVLVPGVFGPQHGKYLRYPFFTMLKTVAPTQFFERFDVLSVLAWGFGLFIDVAVYLYCGSIGLSQLMGLRDNRPLIGPMAVIWVIVAVSSYDDIFDVLRLFQPHVLLPYVTTFLYLPFLLLWLVYLVRYFTGTLPAVPAKKGKERS